MKSVFVFCPAFGHQISSGTVISICELMQAFYIRGIGGGFSTLSFPDIAELRSMAMTIWYDTLKDSDYLLYIDADMGFKPELVLDYLAFDEPVVGCLYPKKILPISYVGSSTGEITAQTRGYFIEVGGVGFGVTMIRRDAVTAIIEKFPEIIDDRLKMHVAADLLKGSGTNRIIRAFDKIEDPKEGWLSEDLSFCRRWRECGGKVWAAVGHTVSHIGLFPFTGKYLDVMNRVPDEVQPLGNATMTAESPAAALPVIEPEPAILEAAE